MTSRIWNGNLSYAKHPITFPLYQQSFFGGESQIESMVCQALSVLYRVVRCGCGIAYDNGVDKLRWYGWGDCRQTLPLNL